MSCFVFNVPAPPGFYTLSLHDALPILHVSGVATGIGSEARAVASGATVPLAGLTLAAVMTLRGDRKSTRLNSSHRCISYAVFCLKNKKAWRLDLVPSRLDSPHRCVAAG